jgi:hypothetical protein
MSHLASKSLAKLWQSLLNDGSRSWLAADHARIGTEPLSSEPTLEGVVGNGRRDLDDTIHVVGRPYRHRCWISDQQSRNGPADEKDFVSQRTEGLRDGA